MSPTRPRRIARVALCANSISRSRTMAAWISACYRPTTGSCSPTSDEGTIMNTEQEVARHYTHGSLEQAILAALKGIGKDVDRLTPADLSAADEFHLGWRAMSVEIGKDLSLTPQMHVLDVGSGIGGPARYFAEAHGCRVTGIDLTEEFVQVAGALSRRCGLAGKVDFHTGSALNM